MKPIAITARLIANTSYPETQEALDIRWGALFQQAGLLPVLLALQFESLDSIFERFQLKGVLFTGGNDLGFII
jgi:hypothetical protein